MLNNLNNGSGGGSSPARSETSAGVAGVGAVTAAPSSSHPPPLPFAIDTAWLSSQEARNRQAREALAARLGQAQAHLHKEAIRAAYLALAEHEASKGGGSGGAGGGTGAAAADLTEAFHLTLRARDYCTTRSQTAMVSLQILELAIALNNYGSVREYVVKLQHTLEGTSTTAGATAASAGSGSGSGAGGAGVGAVGSEVAHFVKIASALEALRNEEFPRAAAILIEMTTGRRPGSPRSSDDNEGNSSSGGSITAAAATEQHSGSTASWPTVLCGEEIALYTGLMALCVLPRRDVVALAEHAEALELAPPVRECLWQFHRGNYQSAWDLLNWPQLKLDCHLGPHVSRLQGLVVKRAILAYWQPYLRVDLPTMAQELSGLVPSTEYLIRHMVDVIGQSHSTATTPRAGAGTTKASKGLTKLLDTRIDLPNQTLVREMDGDEEDEAETCAALKLQDLAADVLDDGYSTIVRLSCLEHNLIVRDPSAAPSSFRDAGGGMMYPPRHGRAGRAARTGGRPAVPSAMARPGFRRGSQAEDNHPAPEREVAAMGAGGEDYPAPMDDDDDDDDNSNDDEIVSSEEGGIAEEEKVDDHAEALSIGDVSEDEDMGDQAAVDYADDMNPEDLY